LVTGNKLFISFMVNATINTALCSFGMSGRVFHAPFITTVPGFRLHGVWERTKNDASQKYPGIKTYRSLDELLADDAVQLVVVNTPSVTHYDYTQQAILAGKHVLVEKPFTATYREAQELITLAATKKIQLSVYHNRRYDSDYRTIQHVLSQQLLGEIVEAEMHFDRYVPALSSKLHKETPTPAVGCLYDLGSHLIDQALQLFGLPLELFADITSNRPGSTVDDYFDLKLIYASHRVTIKSSYYVREALPGYQLHGKAGSFIKPKTNIQETMLQAGHLPLGSDWGKEDVSEYGLLHTEKNGVVIKEYIPSLPGNYADYYRQLHHAIVNNTVVPVLPEDAALVIKIIEAAFQSNREKRIIRLL
jgi:scyllo-inositol 2-dehydrogenase (NADP+)